MIKACVDSFFVWRSIRKILNQFNFLLVKVDHLYSGQILSSLSNSIKFLDEWMFLVEIHILQFSHT